MPKSRIIKEIAEGTVDLETSFNRLYLLASDIQDAELMQWIEKELGGYLSDDLLPDYRKTKSGAFFFNGISGDYQVTNVALPPGYLLKEQRDAIYRINYTDSIRSVIDIVKNGKDFRDAFSLDA